MDSSTSSVRARDRGLAGRPRRGSDQPPTPPDAARALARPAGRRGAARSRRLAGPVPTARRADRLAFVADDPADRLEEPDRFLAEDERVAAGARRDAEDDRADDDRADDVPDALLDDVRVDGVRAERVVDRAGERRDPLGRAPSPPTDVRPDPLREVMA